MIIAGADGGRGGHGCRAAGNYSSCQTGNAADTELAPSFDGDGTGKVKPTDGPGTGEGADSAGLVTIGLGTDWPDGSDAALRLTRDGYQSGVAPVSDELAKSRTFGPSPPLVRSVDGEPSLVGLTAEPEATPGVADPTDDQHRSGTEGDATCELGGTTADVVSIPNHSERGAPSEFGVTHERANTLVNVESGTIAGSGFSATVENDRSINADALGTEVGDSRRPAASLDVPDTDEFAATRTFGATPPPGPSDEPKGTVGLASGEGRQASDTVPAFVTAGELSADGAATEVLVTRGIEDSGGAASAGHPVIGPSLGQLSDAPFTLVGPGSGDGAVPTGISLSHDLVKTEGNVDTGFVASDAPQFVPSDPDRASVERAAVLTNDRATGDFYTRFVHDSVVISSDEVIPSIPRRLVRYATERQARMSGEEINSGKVPSDPIPSVEVVPSEDAIVTDPPRSGRRDNSNLFQASPTFGGTRIFAGTIRQGRSPDRAVTAGIVPTSRPGTAGFQASRPDSRMATANYDPTASLATVAPPKGGRPLGLILGLAFGLLILLLLVASSIFALLKRPSSTSTDPEMNEALYQNQLSFEMAEASAAATQAIMAEEYASQENPLYVDAYVGELDREEMFEESSDGLHLPASTPAEIEAAHQSKIDEKHIGSDVAADQATEQPKTSAAFQIVDVKEPEATTTGGETHTKSPEEDSAEKAAAKDELSLEEFDNESAA